MKLFIQAFAVLPLSAVLWTMAVTPINATTTPATSGYALSFDGTNDFVTVPLNRTLTNYTVSAWVYLRAGGNFSVTRMAVLSATSCGASAELLIRSATASARDPQYLELGRCGSFEGLPSSAPVPVGQWTHVAVSVAQTGPFASASYFINGVSAGVSVVSATAHRLGPNINLGDNSGLRRFDGLLDEVQIWQRALNQTEVQANFRRPLAGTEPGLVAYYRFDEGAGNMALDSASNGGLTHGALNQGPAYVPSGVGFVPEVTTQPGRLISSDGWVFRLDGLVEPRGTNTSVWFEWGHTTDYGEVSPVQGVPPSSNAIPFHAEIGPLTFGKRYHFRAAASNSVGITHGLDFSFRPVQVGTTTDGGTNSLRELLADASDNDVLVVPSGTIILTNELVIDRKVVIQGIRADQTVISGNLAGRVFRVAAGVSSTIADVTIRDGRAAAGADAPSGSQSAGGDGFSGGGIFNAGNLTLLDCYITENRAGAGGRGTTWIGPVFSSGTTGGNGGNGGGIYNTGLLLMLGTTLSANQGGNGGQGGDASVAGNGGNGGTGGGIGNEGTLHLTQCTLDGNVAGSGGASGQGLGLPGVAGAGGGILNAGTLIVTASTISDNSGASGGGIHNAANATVELRSVLVALNAASRGPDLAGAYTSLGHNLVGQTNGNTGFISGFNIVTRDRAGDGETPLDPKLAPLANNGGPTPTRALLPLSPAISTGDDALLGWPFHLTTDQRGAPRRYGLHVDAGAHELFPPLPPTVTALPPDSLMNNPITGSVEARLRARVNPNGYPTLAWFEFGPGTNRSSTVPIRLTGFADQLVNTQVAGLVPGVTYYFRAAASNEVGITFGPGQSLTSPASVFQTAGDRNGDGVVDANEITCVLSNHWRFVPPTITSLTSPSNTVWHFDLDTLTNLSLMVLATADVSAPTERWEKLGPAALSYRVVDPAATNHPARFYQLRWP